MTSTEDEKATRTQMKEAMECLIREVEDGLYHGFFEYALICQLVKGKKRRFTIKAGKEFQFTIPEDELPLKR